LYDIANFFKNREGGNTMKITYSFFLFSFFFLITISLNAQLCRIPCRACNGKGVIPVTVHGLPGVYGCTACGGVKGDPFNNIPGSPGKGYIEVPCPDNNNKISSDQQSSPNNDAELKRAREAQLQKEAEEARQKQVEFEKTKQEALKNMKGITEGELGLKGVDNEKSGLKGIDDANVGTRGLKGISSQKSADQIQPCDCEWGNTNTSVVDLRCLGLDPNKAVTIDPHVVRGQERSFPVQVDPKTFENVNYNKGFEALMHFDVASASAAIQYFEQARKERPNDPCVRNGLLLAQDIYNARLKKEIETNKAHAAELTRQTYAAFITEDLGSARSYIAHARELDPNNNAILFLNSTLSIIKPESIKSGTPEVKAAYKLAGHSILSIAKENYYAANSILEVARKMAPNEPLIYKLSKVVSDYEAGQTK